MKVAGETGGGGFQADGLSDLVSVECTVLGENRQKVIDIILADSLIQSQSNGLVIQLAQVDTEANSLVNDGGSIIDLDGKGIEINRVLNGVTGLLDAFSQNGSQVVNALSNGFQALERKKSPKATNSKSVIASLTVDANSLDAVF